MSGSLPRSLKKALAGSKTLPSFMERVFDDWRNREGSRDFFELLTNAAVSAGIVDRRGKPPERRSVLRAWSAYKKEREKRRIRMIEIATEEAAWETAISIVPSRRQQSYLRLSWMRPSQTATGPPAYPNSSLDRHLSSSGLNDDDDDALIRRMLLNDAGCDPEE